jgi:hypothetical protein
VSALPAGSLRCENEHCRNSLPAPPPLVVSKLHCDGRGRVRPIQLAFCSWHCVEAVAARAKEYAAEELRRACPKEEA